MRRQGDRQVASLNVVLRERPEDLSEFDLWNDPAWQRFGWVRSLALAGERFTGRLEYGTIGPISVCRITAAGHRVEHEAEDRTTSAQARLKVLAQVHGSSRFIQGRNLVDLSPGDFVIYESSAAYSFVNPQSVEQIVMSIPAERVALGSDGPERVLGRRLSARSGSARLALALVRVTLDELQHCDEQAASQVAESICRLLVDALRDLGGRGHIISLKVVLRTRALDFIEANLSDPELDVDVIAKRLNCSKRYLHEAFGKNGFTIARYIRKRRLERCKDELVNVNRVQRSLTDIALSWGFKDSAHFSKVFKREFGASPSDFRPCPKFAATKPDS
jgi:AraC-like DNA-binding protein